MLHLRTSERPRVQAPVQASVEAPSAPQAMIQTTSSSLSPTTATPFFLQSECTHAAGPGDSSSAPMDQFSAQAELLRLEELQRQLLEEQRELKKENRRLKYLSKTGKKFMVDASTNTP